MPQVNSNSTMDICTHDRAKKKRADFHRYFKMVGVEKQDSLRFLKLLVSLHSVSVDLWENDRGDLFIRLPLQDKQSYLLAAVENETLLSFFMDECTLEEIVQWSPSPFVWLQDGDSEHYMYLPDADLALLYKDARYSDLKAASQEP